MVKNHQHMFTTVVAGLQFSTVPLGVDYGSLLNNTTWMSLKDKGNSALPPLFAMPSCSTVREGPIQDRYSGANLVALAFEIFECVETSKGLLVKALRVNSTTECVSALLGKS